MTVLGSVVTDSLRLMFEEARQKGLWFFSPYQQLWFSPDELQENQKNGRFCWGAVNWELRDPKERVEQLRLEAAALVRQADQMAGRIS
jgi:hypothetical protein